MFPIIKHFEDLFSFNCQFCNHTLISIDYACTGCKQDFKLAFMSPKEVVECINNYNKQRNRVLKIGKILNT